MKQILFFDSKKNLTFFIEIEIWNKYFLFSDSKKKFEITIFFFDSIKNWNRNMKKKFFFRLKKVTFFIEIEKWKKNFFDSKKRIEIEIWDNFFFFSSRGLYSENIN